jgi:toxin ParE1/3/4
MKSVIFSPAASADIDGIYDYTEENWGYEQAEAYAFGLKDACLTVASGARRGRHIGGLKAGYLALAYRSHFVIYRDRDTRIIIVRILHQRMNIMRHL